MRTERPIFFTLFAVILALVAYPLGALFFGSFQSKGGGLTLDHWRAASETPLLWISLRNTVLTSTGATLLALIIGVSLVMIKRISKALRRK